jgi:hypothetical protein
MTTTPTFDSYLLRLRAERPAWERHYNVEEYEDYDAFLADGTMVRLMIPTEAETRSLSRDGMVLFTLFDADEQVSDHVEGRVPPSTARELLRDPARFDLQHAGEGEQMTCWQNGTLQSAGAALAVTIQTFVAVPAEVCARGEAAVVRFLLETLETAGPAATFALISGPSQDAEDAEDAQ